MSTRTKRPLRIFLLVVSAICALTALWLLSLASLDIRTYASARHGNLASVLTEPLGSDSVFSRSLLTLSGTTGLTARCAMLTPRDTQAKAPAFILLGGKATGKDAVTYVVDLQGAYVVALDYPYEPRPSYSFGEVLEDLSEVRTALLDMVPLVMLVTDYLSSLPAVDTARIVMVGYSFGAPFIPATMAVDGRIDAGVMAYSGGNVSELIYHNVRLYEGEMFSRFVGWAAAILLRPIEPMRYVGEISPRPVLMVNGSEDERIPRENVAMLFANAKEPKRMVWIRSGHVHPTNEELTRQIIRDMLVVMKEWGMMRSPYEEGEGNR